jgi:hypothetical protein
MFVFEGGKPYCQRYGGDKAFKEILNFGGVAEVADKRNEDENKGVMHSMSTTWNSAFQSLSSSFSAFPSSMLPSPPAFTVKMQIVKPSSKSFDTAQQGMFKDQMLRQGLPDQVDKEAITISNIDYDGSRGLVTFDVSVGTNSQNLAEEIAMHLRRKYPEEKPLSPQKSSSASSSTQKKIAARNKQLDHVPPQIEASSNPALVHLYQVQQEQFKKHKDGVMQDRVIDYEERLNLIKGKGENSSFFFSFLYAVRPLRKHRL